MVNSEWWIVDSEWWMVGIAHQQYKLQEGISPKA
jgi:hypothetical protein